MGVFACPQAAAAQHNQLDWISNGPTGASAHGNTCAKCGIGISADGSRVAFTTDVPLTADDTNAGEDVYLSDHGAVTLVSRNGGGEYAAATPDLSHIYFKSIARLTPEDTDSDWDIYEWSGGVLTLVSTGAPFDCRYQGDRDCLQEPGSVSADGSHVFFSTYAQLAPEDTDTALDVYDRTGGTTRLVSTPPGSDGSQNVEFRAASSDGSKVFFTSVVYPSRLYEQSNGIATQIPWGFNSTVLNAISKDGSRVFFTTTDSLLPSDQDNNTCVGEGQSSLYQRDCADVYEYSNGTLKLVSAKPDGSGGTGGDAVFGGLSADEQHVFFTTGKPLVPEDTDGQCRRTTYIGGSYVEYFVGCNDVYDRSGGTTTLISTGSTNSPQQYDAAFDDASADGSHVLFETEEPLFPGDNSNSGDVFERTGGATNWVSVGATRNGGFAGLVSDDGSRVVFQSFYQLLPEDSDQLTDVYERAGGHTYLITDFAAIPAIGFVLFAGASPDLGHVFIETADPASSGDTDHCPERGPSGTAGCADLYEASIGSPDGFPRPKGAGPMYVPLVPAYKPCLSPNRTHGAPLSFPSCAPPARAPGYLTVGTPDSNGAGARSVGSMTISVKPGNAATEADDADVRFALSFTDVRLASTLDDYTGELRAHLPIRFTDTGRWAPITNPPQTTIDAQILFTAVCSPTPSTTEGSTCAATTTADAVVPGAVREGNRAIWQVGQIDVTDGGQDGDVDTPDNGIFARQGVFTP